MCERASAASPCLGCDARRHEPVRSVMSRAESMISPEKTQDEVPIYERRRSKAWVHPTNLSPRIPRTAGPRCDSSDHSYSATCRCRGHRKTLLSASSATHCFLPPSASEPAFAPRRSVACNCKAIAQVLASQCPTARAQHLEILYFKPLTKQAAHRNRFHNTTATMQVTTQMPQRLRARRMATTPLRHIMTTARNNTK